MHPDVGALVATGILAQLLFFSIRPALLGAKSFLLLVCLVASTCGVCATFVSSKLRRARHEIVRDGCRGAFLSAVATAGMLVAFSRFADGTFTAVRALVAVVPSILPATFCGLIASVLTVIALIPPVNGESTPTGGSRLAMIVAVLVAVLGFSSPLMPSMPAPQSQPVEQPKAVFVPAPQPAPVPAPVVPAFQYEVPTELKSATADEISVVARKNFGRIRNGSPLVISGGSRYLAFLPEGREQLIEVMDLHRAASVLELAHSASVGALSFSPDGKLLLCDRPAEFVRLTVIEIDSGRVTALPMPKGQALPKCGLLWWEDNEVLVFPRSDGVLLLDLRSLLLADAAKSPRWSALSEKQREKVRATRLAAFEEPAWQFAAGDIPVSAELPETQGTAGWDKRTASLWGFADEKRAFADFRAGFARTAGDRVLLSPDRAKLAIVQNDVLRVLYLGVASQAQLTFGIEMKQAMPQCADREAVAEAMEGGELAAFIYAPMVNPLTAEVVGPDRGRIKARARFLQWEDKSAAIWTEALYQPVIPGDIVADLHSSSASGKKPFAVQPSEPWWTVLDGKPASAALAIPSRERLAEMKKEQEAKAMLKVTKPQEPPLPASPLASAEKPQPWNAKMVTVFILAHHKKASSGDISGMVADYADQVDHFNNGMVNREFILKDETVYHAKFLYVDEEVKSDIKVRALPNGLIEAAYLLSIHWQARSNNELGGGEFDVMLELQSGSNGLRIVKHRSAKRNP